MDDQAVAATLTAAILAKTELPAGKDPVAVAVYSYRRMLKSVARVHAAEERSAAKAPIGMVRDDRPALLKSWQKK